MEINREILKSSVRIRRRKVSPMLAVGCIAFFTLFILTIYITRLNKLYITNVFISGNKQVDDSRIFKVVNDELVGTYYGIYPRSSILIYPKDEIAKTLLHNIPWLASVEVAGSMNTISLNVVEREPKYLWCDDFTKPILDRVCYYLDKNGYAFDKAPNFSGHIYLEFYGGNKRGGYSGRSVLPLDTLNVVLNAENSMEKIIESRKFSLGTIYGINIYSNGDYDALISNGDKDWKINFDLNTDPVKKFRAVIDSQFFNKELENPENKLDYIDLRFGKKVFYKFVPVKG